MTTTLPVTLRALVQRINRRLKADGRLLRAARARAQSEVGRFYLLDPNRGQIVQTHVDPETLARELGVLDRFETVA